MREANTSLNEIVEASSKAFDLSLMKLQLEDNNFSDNSVESTIQNVPDVGFFDLSLNKDDFFRGYISFS